jgi:hypothetical protein
MGYYLNGSVNGQVIPAVGKANFLLAHASATETSDHSFQENLVCVVENGPFDAAAFIFSPAEALAFQDPKDRRRKRWLLVPNAALLAGYKQ